jgi:hypothetical protein
MSAARSFVSSAECDHVSTACLFCTDERPLDLFGPDWGRGQWKNRPASMTTFWPVVLSLLHRLTT